MSEAVKGAPGVFGNAAKLAQFFQTEDCQHKAQLKLILRLHGLSNTKKYGKRIKLDTNNAYFKRECDRIKGLHPANDNWFEEQKGELLKNDLAVIKEAFDDVLLLWILTNFPNIEKYVAQPHHYRKLLFFVFTHYADNHSNQAQPSPEQTDITSPIVPTTSLKRPYEEYTELGLRKKPFFGYNQGEHECHQSQLASGTASQSVKSSFYLERTDEGKQTSSTTGVDVWLGQNIVPNCGVSAENTCPSNGDAQGPMSGSKYPLAEMGAEERRPIQGASDHSPTQDERVRCWQATPSWELAEGATGSSNEKRTNGQDKIIVTPSQLRSNADERIDWESPLSVTDKDFVYAGMTYAGDDCRIRYRWLGFSALALIQGTVCKTDSDGLWIYTHLGRDLVMAVLDKNFLKSVQRSSLWKEEQQYGQLTTRCMVLLTPKMKTMKQFGAYVYLEFTVPRLEAPPMEPYAPPAENYTSAPTTL
ncbi:hypothetical protein HBH98_254420 [Parastagonospora nodorum]|nr:hypothetical protein HBH53_258880 [Parastagonospora nodorum]KAH3956081.1 hypothetical protein HBH51_255940 [Parastagonospora nodorum]KAH4215333.1 hypothetical protein HBI06_256240 [Parastagonospora nodorum]KAH4223047.1 hypothetical protein HBI05_252040 [Parastagonospora nodorum]KAH4332117.1 hypothetical protein HBH98_254420 [Parastagonospora nodorum]